MNLPDATVPDAESALLQAMRSSSSDRPALHVALYLHSRSLRRFERALITSLLKTDFIRVIALVTHQQVHVASPGSSLLFRSFVRFQDSRFTPADNANQRVDCEDLLAGIPVVDATDLPAIGALALDVMLCLCGCCPADPMHEQARAGVWRYHLGDSQLGQGDPPQAWEFVTGCPVTTVELHRLQSRARPPQILDRVTLSMSGLPAISPSQSLAGWGGMHLALQQLRRMHEGQAPIASGSDTAPPGVRRRIQGPGNAAMAGWALGWAKQKIYNRIHHRGEYLHWRVALRPALRPLLEYEPGKELEGFRWIETPPGRFWADPFITQDGDRHWLFVEEFDYRRGHAHLSVAEIDAHGEVGEATPILQTGEHLSYPHVFAVDGEHFMVPESSAAGTVDLWRATKFPFEWRRECCLLPMCAVDSTVFFASGRWWMFTTPLVAREIAAATLLYCAEQLTGPWRLHPVAPICADVRWARGAGAVMEQDGRRIRIAQDCGGAYGKALAINEIVHLDPTHYAERPVRQIGPGSDSGIYGVHTYNRAGKWEAIDSRTYRPRRAAGDQ